MERKRIAVITARADDNDQRSIICGIAERMLPENVDIVVYSNVFNHWVEDEALSFENVIYDYFRPELFDGAIVTAEAFYKAKPPEDILNRIRRSNIPAVIIGGFAEGFMSVSSDDENDFEAIAEHLVSVHGFRSIDILAGGRDSETSERRLSGCLRALARHEITPHAIHYGNFWNDSGETLAREYASGRAPMPEAVICGNDYMAFGLCDELTQLGVKVPEQISVIGYEYSDGRIFHYPVISTFRRNRRKMGTDAAEILLFGKRSDAAHESCFIPGNSCSCGANDCQLNEEIRSARLGQYFSVMSSVAGFASKLTLSRSLSEYMGVIKEYLYLLHSAEDVKMCVQKNRNNPGDSAYLCCGIDETSPRQYDKNSLPPFITEGDKPRLYYFSPLTFEKRKLGYSVLCYSQPGGYDFSFRDWNKTAANTLALIDMKNDIHYLKQCQSVSLLYDSLTGFYGVNELRQIIDNLSEDELQESRIYGVKICYSGEGEFLYGENYRSDIAASVARAIKKECKAHELCARADGDLFLILHRRSDNRCYERVRAGVFYALSEDYDESRAIVSFIAPPELSPQKAVDEVSKTAQNAALEWAERYKRCSEMPHYKELLEIHCEIVRAPESCPDTESLCRRLCISEGHFRLLYREYFGVSYVQDCIRARITLAEYLLCSTSMSIFAVSKRCGYSDEKFFSRQFRQLAGCSPAHFR